MRSSATCLPAKRPWATYESVLLVFLCFAEFLKCCLYQFVILLCPIVQGVGKFPHSFYTNYNLHEVKICSRTFCTYVAIGGPLVYTSIYIPSQSSSFSASAECATANIKQAASSMCDVFILLL